MVTKLRRLGSSATLTDDPDLHANIKFPAVEPSAVLRVIGTEILRYNCGIVIRNVAVPLSSTSSQLRYEPVLPSDVVALNYSSVPFVWNVLTVPPLRLFSFHVVWAEEFPAWYSL